jgi:hypothetical protein
MNTFLPSEITIDIIVISIGVMFYMFSIIYTYKIVHYVCDKIVNTINTKGK